MENENEVNDTPTNEGDAATLDPQDTGAPETPVQPDENIDELKKKAELADNYKARAEKAERELKKKKDVKAPEELTLTSKDTIALINAKVHTDDFETITEWAKFRKIPVSDALKDKTLQTVLREKDEERKTAEATNVRGGQRGAQKATSEEVINKARKGELPNDDAGMEALVDARLQEKRAKLRR